MPSAATDVEPGSGGPRAADATAEQLLWAEPSRLKPPVAPTDLAYLSPREQVLLYALVFGLAPRRVLEVGVMHGGGSRIIHAALSDLGRGVLVALDMAPQLRIEWDSIADRATLLVGKSPDDLARAMEIAGGPFDFVFLDGNHSVEGVKRDLDGLMRVTARGAVILAHDAHYWEVARAFDEAIRSGMPIRDSGLVTSTGNAPEDGGGGMRPPDGGPIVWGGLRAYVRR